MNTLRNILIAATAMSAVAGAAAAQTSASATAPADAKIIQPIAMSNTGSSTLSFGTIARGSNASVVRLTSGNSRSIQSGNATLAGGTTHVAAFAITGEPSANVTLAAAAFDLTSGANTVTVTPALSVSNSTALDGTGALAFTVGGDLALAGGQASGTYNGTLNVTVQYQ